jgi:hypothetical protein
MSGRGLPPVPHGIQQLLRLASVDPAFCEELVTRRGAVADAAGIALNRTERQVLAVASEAMLRGMVAQLPPAPRPRMARLRSTAATAVVLLGGAALAGGVTGCDGGGETAVNPPADPVEVVTPAPAQPPPLEDLPATDEAQEADPQGLPPDTPPQRETTLPAIGGHRADTPLKACDDGDS